MEPDEREPRAIVPMADLLKGIVPEKPIKTTKIHSKDHDLARQLCKFFNEKKFGMWLGVIKKYGFDNVYREWKGLSDYQREYTGKLLMWKLKQNYGGKTTNTESREVQRSTD